MPSHLPRRASHRIAKECGAAVFLKALARPTISIELTEAARHIRVTLLGFDEHRDAGHFVFELRVRDLLNRALEIRFIDEFLVHGHALVLGDGFSENIAVGEELEGERVVPFLIDAARTGQFTERSPGQQKLWPKN